jgi:hypothetical protein
MELSQYNTWPLYQGKVKGESKAIPVTGRGDP